MGRRDAGALAQRIGEELASCGHRRVMLLGSGTDVRDSPLRHELARRGFQVLIPPVQEQEWLDQAIVQGPPQGDDARVRHLGALMADGMEHGVGAAVLLCEELSLLVDKAGVDIVRVEAWKLALPNGQDLAGRARG